MPTRRLVLVGAIITVIAVAGGTAVLVGRSHSKAATPRTVTQIKQRMLQAISASDGEILQQVVKGSGSGHVEAWQYLETGKYASVAYSASGQPLTATFASETGGVFRLHFVDYQYRTWNTVSSAHSSRPRQGGTQQLEDMYRNLVTRGYFSLVGTGTIDGTRVIYLRLKLPAPAGFPIAPTTVYLCVDASTYLPVLQVMTRDSAVVGTTDYSLLPRSEANLTKLYFVAPAGFTHTQGTETFSNEARAAPSAAHRHRRHDARHAGGVSRCRKLRRPDRPLDQRRPRRRGARSSGVPIPGPTWRPARSARSTTTRRRQCARALRRVSGSTVRSRPSTTPPALGRPLSACTRIAP